MHKSALVYYTWCICVGHPEGTSTREVEVVEVNTEYSNQYSESEEYMNVQVSLSK